MNPLTQTSWTLTGAWLALTAVAGAQAPEPSAGRPPPRVPRAVLPESQVTSGAAPAVRLEEDFVRPTQVGPPMPESEPESEPDAQRVMRVSATDERYSRVYWDTDEHGSTWVHGRRYKASFGIDGATYYPFFGSDQPRHYPLQMSLAGATSNGQPIPLSPVTGAVRDGERVVIERGVIDEVYEIGVEAVEQTFVVGERPQGDLKLFVSLSSQMTRCERDDGFEFTNELGAVRYSRAFARGADGTRRALATRLVEGGVEIEVGADYLATAQFPLVVDPIVSTFDVDATTYYNYRPKVAYDATTNRYLYIYQQLFTSTDYDVFCRLTSASGAVISEESIDQSTDNCSGLGVANLNAYDQFCVLVRISGNRIVARQTSAHTLLYGPAFTVADGLTEMHGTIGGDPYETGPSFYCVTWSGRSGGLGSTDVEARLVTSTGTLVGSGPLVLGDTSDEHRYPEVSPGNAGNQWNVVWGSAVPSWGTSSTTDVWGAQISWDGLLVTSSFPIATSSYADSHPTVTSPFSNGEYLVVWLRAFDPDRDIMAARVAGNSVLGVYPLTHLEAAGNLYQDQDGPRVECDGERFVLVYDEREVNGYRAWLSSFAMDAGTVNILESHVSLSPFDNYLANPVVASNASAGGGSRRFVLGWDEEIQGVRSDIEGAFFDATTTLTYCYGDGSGTACPCGNNGGVGRGCASSVNPSGASLIAVGTSDVSADNMQLRANGMPSATTCLFFQGTTSGPNAGLGAPFGDGLRCTGGSVVRLATKTTVLGVGLYPQAGDASISVQGNIPAWGGVRYYQAWYRNSAAFCTSSVWNLSNGARIVWLP